MPFVATRAQRSRSKRLMTSRSYSQLIRLDGYAERFRYLSLKGRVGQETFGSERHLNQGFYTSREWRTLRNHIIARDYARDLGVEGFEIERPLKIYIHHLNPMTVDDVQSRNPANFDPEFLISVTHRTHNAIHYGDENVIPRGLTVRTPNDTKLW